MFVGQGLMMLCTVCMYVCMQERHRQLLLDIEDQIGSEQQRAEDERAKWEAEQRVFYDQKERLKEQVGRQVGRQVGDMG